MKTGTRLLLVHKQKTSGRLRYLCLPSGILAFTPLPAEAVLRGETWSQTLQVHPTAPLREAEIHLGLPEDALEPVPEFQCWAETAQGDLPVLIGAFTAIDPPFAAAERIGARFIAITESRHLTPIERDLMRRAYEHLLG